MLTAERLFAEFAERDFLPANEAYRDGTRQALDRAVLLRNSLALRRRIPRRRQRDKHHLHGWWFLRPDPNGEPEGRSDTITICSMVSRQALPGVACQASSTWGTPTLPDRVVTIAVPSVPSPVSRDEWCAPPGASMVPCSTISPERTRRAPPPPPPIA